MWFSAKSATNRVVLVLGANHAEHFIGCEMQSLVLY